MAKRVDFVFTKDYGLTKKDTVRSMNRAFARTLQDIEKVGKIIGEAKSQGETEAEKKIVEQSKKLEAMKKELDKAKKERAIALKMQKNIQNKMDKLAQSRATK